ncbi:MAG: [ribosomal protein S5]-alanine N-acetyltransferase [Frankiaceae bacterium]|nr:[ribosomal protein S5]-alanine N-acetyltransferase [Frankiaceae bacterium]
MRQRDDATGWPVTLRSGDLTLRPIVLRDAPAWVGLRRRNAAWIGPWESTPPGRQTAEPSVAGFVAYALDQRRLANAGLAMPFAIMFGGEFVGQISVASVTRGAVQSASLGYWIDEGHAGRGIVPTAVALVVDHCFTVVGLHRLEINVRPENTASLRVVEKLGFREEGLKRGFLYVVGDFRDHVSFALLHEDVAPGGLLSRWLAQQSRQG